ncbi:MAG: hypothetical protein Q7T20_05335 [Saprospiraceae bacterium]|nr:hypothetical protein [Saprospiraceae bacterium]
MRKAIYFFTFCIYLFPTISIDAQWIKTNGLSGGHTSRFFNYGDTVLTNVGNELHYSINHGKVWSPIVNPLYRSINPLSIEGQNVFGYAHDRSAQENILFISHDFFQTLHPVSIPDTLDLRGYFLAHGHLYISEYSNTVQKLYRTNNHGASWEFVAALSPNDVQFDGQRITGDIYHNVIQSTDEGFTWDTLLQYSGWISQILQHENHFFIFHDDPTEGCNVSHDFGQSWQFYPNSNLDQFYRYFWHNGSIYGLDANRAIRSSDLGQSWENVTLPQNSASPAYHGISSGNALIIGGAQSMGSSGMHRSIDHGNTWNAVSFGLAASSGKLRKYSHELFVPSPGGLFRGKFDGLNWEKLNLNT